MTSTFFTASSVKVIILETTLVSEINGFEETIFIVGFAILKRPSIERAIGEDINTLTVGSA